MSNTFLLEELRSLLEKARAADAELKQFGAKDHKYQWNPPASLKEIEEFEQETGISLPDGYRNPLHSQLHSGSAGGTDDFLFHPSGGISPPGRDRCDPGRGGGRWRSRFFHREKGRGGHPMRYRGRGLHGAVPVQRVHSGAGERRSHWRL